MGGARAETVGWREGGASKHMYVRRLARDQLPDQTESSSSRQAYVAKTPAQHHYYLQEVSTHRYYFGRPALCRLIAP